MSVFGGLILTNRGRNLLIKSQLGATLNYTRIAIGDGVLGGSSILDLAALKHEVKTLPITKLKALTGGRFIVGSAFSNNDISSGFYYRELGLFAQDPDLGEILYCYANAGELAEYIAAGGGVDIIEKAIELEVILANVSNVTATIDSSLVYATQQDVQALQQQIDNIEVPVTSVNTKTGAVVLSASDINTSSGQSVETSLAEKTTILTASGTANAITLNVALEDKGKYSFKAVADSTGAVTINGIPLKKTDGTAVSNLKVNKVYDFYYDATANSVFILAKAEGDALVGDVLAGKGFSNINDIGLVGILALTGTASISDVLNGKTFYNTDAKTKATGSMVNNGAKTYTPSSFTQTGTAGYYSGITVNPVPSTYKRWASGTVTSPSGITNYTPIGGGGLYIYTITVTGLSFTPSFILVSNLTVSSYPTIYKNGGIGRYNGVNGNCAVCFNTATYLLDVSSVTSSGFTLPVGLQNTSYTWYAFE